MQHMYMWLQTAAIWLHTVVSIATYTFSVICSFMQDFSSHWWYISSCLLLLCIDFYFGGLDPLQYPWVMIFSWCTYIKVSDTHTNCSPVVASAACCAHYISLRSWAETFTISCFLELLHSTRGKLQNVLGEGRVTCIMLIPEKNEGKETPRDVCINTMCITEMFHKGANAVIKYPS